MARQLQRTVPERAANVSTRVVVTPKSHLGGREPSVAEQRDLIVAAIDFLTTGI